MNCIFLRRGYGTIESKPQYAANFADNEWAAIIAACQENAVPDTWVVGNSKAMTISGTSYTIDIIGKNHDTYSAGGTAPLTFQFHDCHNTTAVIASDGNNTYNSTKMKTTTLPNILNQMPSEVKAAIKEVTKTTCNGNTLTTIVTTAEKLFLLSEVEVTGSKSYSGNGEGSKYAYYSSSTQRKKNLNGSTSYWWTRSPVSSSGSRNVAISTTGSASSQTVTSTYGVAPAFCF